MNIHDYRTFGDFLQRLLTSTKAGEVSLREGTEEWNPWDLLASLDSKESSSSDITYRGGAGGEWMSVRFAGLLSTVERTFEILWSAERQGWSSEGAVSKVAHYYVPKASLKESPYCGDDVLVALCKRSFHSVTMPFVVGPNRQLCKNCERKFADFHSA